uniref:hypothetical protein n=1 Tax=Agathobacter sp. TaxID=2021311 RepID=UPI0040569932
MRFSYVKRPAYLLEQLSDLEAEPKEYPFSDMPEVRKEDFITQDEIDYRLAGGSHFEHGTFRIYEYFTETHNKKEREDFLKNEYGTGGSSHALPGSDVAHEDHDARGIISPILANIYLDKFDKYIGEYIKNFNKGKYRK